MERKKRVSMLDAISFNERFVAPAACRERRFEMSNRSKTKSKSKGATVQQEAYFQASKVWRRLKNYLRQYVSY